MTQPSRDLGKRLAVLRFIPIVVLVILAFGLELGFGVPRLWAAGIGLVTAVAVRLFLVRVIR